MEQKRIDEIRERIRSGRSPSLRRQRRIVALAALGLSDFIAISLYQSGVIRHLPDPPHPAFASDQINLSRKAFARGGPDGPTGAGLYTLQMWLATRGGDRRSGRHRFWDWALFGVSLGGVGAAVDYLIDMLIRQKKVCVYCLGGALLNFSIARLALAQLLDSNSFRSNTRPFISKVIYAITANPKGNR